MGEILSFFQSLKDLFARFSPKKKTLGVAFGSGGAKGMAHLGVLKAFEEEKIRFDAYAGTSIGSIVGALRAYGYTSDEMKEVVLHICLKQYVRYLRPYMDMGFVEDLLNEYLHGKQFSDLKYPFYAWATDKEKIEGVLLNSGSLARACTASSAIPPYFHSVDIDGRELIDGVYTNPVPADVLRERGADFVLGVDLNFLTETQDGKPVRPHSVITRVLSDTLDSTVKITPKPNALKRGYAACDFILKPPLDTYTPLDASKAALLQMYEIGYQTAKEQMPAIKAKMAEVLKK